MFEHNDLLLFQGDSITDAFRKPEEIGTSYKLGAGYAMIVAARLAAERPELNLRFDNRGVSGQPLEGMAQRWPSETLDLEPDVLSVLTGVNDTNHAVAKPGPEQDELRASFGDRYAALLDAVRERRPGLRLILLEPFVLKTGRSPTRTSRTWPRGRRPSPISRSGTTPCSSPSSSASTRRRSRRGRRTGCSTGSTPPSRASG